MRNDRTQRLSFSLSGDNQLSRLASMMERHGGTFLNVLVRGEEEVEAFQPATGARILNEFCDLICGTEEGLKRCSTCRYLIACACHEKLSRYCCHGGISVLAAPVRRQTGKGEGFLVVTSGPFRRGDGSDRWKDVLEHVRGLPVSRRELRASYMKLPVLEEPQQELVGELVELASLRIGELMDGAAGAGAGASRAEIDTLLPPVGDYEFAMALAREGEMDEPGAPALVRLVSGIVSRNPGLLFSVDKIARAARITPNYFSALFRKHTGQTFTGFLSKQRVRHGRELLRDFSLNISEVARRCGFQDANYFSRAFKRHTGESPSEWRRRHAADGS